MSKKKSKKELPVLNILWASKEGEKEQVLFFLNIRYNVNVLNIENLTTYPDIIIYTGGEDINPAIYREKVGSKTVINKKRDELECNIFYKFQHIPKLGICRGAQLLCALSGGKIIQHVKNHSKNNHLITTNRKEYGYYDYEITSSHHQMMNPFVLGKKNSYELIAWSTFFKSPLYLNGNNEDSELNSNFLEPEIVYFNETKSLCIQGHPEYTNCRPETTLYCLDLINRYLVNIKGKK